MFVGSRVAKRRILEWIEEEQEIRRVGVKKNMQQPAFTPGLVRVKNVAEKQMQQRTTAFTSNVSFKGAICSSDCK